MFFFDLKHHIIAFERGLKRVYTINGGKQNNIDELVVPKNVTNNNEHFNIH